MGYECYWDEERRRWAGYGVIAYCEHPDCNNEIHRGIDNLCHSCGLAFCCQHLHLQKVQSGEQSEFIKLCDRCDFEYLDKDKYYPENHEFFKKKPEHPEWVKHCKKIGQKLVADEV